MILVTALQRRLRRKAVAKLCEWPSSRCVSDSSRYIRSRAQYAAKWCVVVTVEPPKGTEGITRHDEASLSQHMAAETGGWRRPSKRSVRGGGHRYDFIVPINDVTKAAHALSRRLLGVRSLELIPNTHCKQHGYMRTGATYPAPVRNPITHE